MDAVLHSPDVDESEIRVRVHSVHRQSQSLFHSAAASQTVNMLKQTTDSSTLRQAIDSGTRLRASHIILKRSPHSGIPAQTPAARVTSETPASTAETPASNGSVIAPYKCGIRSGAGSYLFMGRIRLKRAILKCAPRLEDFLKVYRNALADGSNYCTLWDL